MTCNTNSLFIVARHVGMRIGDRYLEERTLGPDNFLLSANGAITSVAGTAFTSQYTIMQYNTTYNTVSPFLILAICLHVDVVCV